MHRKLSIAAIAALALTGCAMSDDRLAGLLVSPDKYSLYSCEEIAAEARKTAEREQELQQLMARASTDSAGRLIGDAAYGTDYLTAKGNMNELHAAAISKKCNVAPGAAVTPAPGNAAPR